MSLIPLMKEAYYIFYLGRVDKPTDWNDIIAYSADLTNIFIPHAENPIYKDLVNFIARNNGICYDYGIILNSYVCSFHLVKMR